MTGTVFDYKSYKTYLNEWIRAQPRRGHGLRSSLSHAIGCQTAYTSQVLGGNAHFSLEQAQALNPFLGHSKEEAHYFLLLLQQEKAGTQALKTYFADQIQYVLERRLVLKHRLDVKKSLTREDQATYYSAWYYAAIHVMLSIPELQTKDALARHVGLRTERVAQILDFLVSVGLAVQEGAQFKIGTTRIHLESDSPMIAKHHTNWRMRAITSFDREPDRDLHYSSVVTLSREDVMTVKSLLIKAIEQAKIVIKDSKEEEAYCFSLDFFEV